MRIRSRVAAAMATGLLLAGVAPAFASDPPNDPDFPKQYGPTQIGALDAWTQSTGSGVLVAVVDSGVDVDHPDLKAKLVIRPGSDVADGDDNPDDDSLLKDGEGKVVRGHGTGGAGVIGAITGNGVGIAGVAPDVKILPVKVFPSKSGSLGSLSSVPAGIRFAVDQGAQVINLSVGTLGFGNGVGFIETPCREAYLRGSLCVVSSGNARANDPRSGYASDVDFLNVTANDRDAQPAPFAQNADTKWGLSAPGVAVYTTWALEDGGYQEVNGTSFSAPHASGVAALLFAQGLKVSEVVQRMLQTARPMGEPTRNGAGLVDAAAAVGAVRTEVKGSTPQEQANNNAVLLPKAATRTPTSSAPGPASASPAAQTSTARAVTPAAGATATTVDNGGFGDTDFNADLTGATSDSALGLGVEPAATRTELVFYMLVTFAVMLVAGTGLTAWGRIRRLRST